MNILISALSANEDMPSNGLLKLCRSILVADCSNENKLTIVCWEAHKVYYEQLLSLKSTINIMPLYKEVSRFKMIMIMRRLILNHNIKVIHAPGYSQLAILSISTILAFKRKKTKVIVSDRSTNRWENKWERIKTMLAIVIFRPIMHVLNTTHARNLNENYLLRSITKFVVSNASEQEEVCATSVQKRAKETINRDSFKIVCLKSIRHDTGHENIIKLGRILAETSEKFNVEIHIVGRDHTNNFDNLIKMYKLENMVTNHGYLEKDDALGLLQSMDVGILLSPAEMCPNFLIECLQYGIPIIGYNVQGVSDVIENGINGYIVEKGGEKIIASLLVYMYSSSSVYNSLSDGALLTARKYTARNIGKQLLQHYSALQ